MQVYDKIKELRAYAKKNHIPVINEDTAKVLGDLLKEIKPKNVLEVGTSIGVSGLTILANSSATLTTIEKEEKAYLHAAKNFRAMGYIKRCELILGDCFNEIMLMSKEFDFVFLDGPKGHNKELLQLVTPLLKDEGYIFVDNIFFHGKTLKEGHIEHKHRTIVRNLREFIDYVKKNKKFEVRLLRTGDGIAIIKKL